MPQQPDEFAQYARPSTTTAPKDEFAQYARSTPKATIPTEKQAAATPPIAPTTLPSVKPMDPSPLSERVGKTMDVMGGAALGRFEQRHPQFGPSMQMVSGTEMGSAPVASAFDEAVTMAKNAPAAISRGIDKLAGVPSAIAKEESAAAATRAGNVAKFREVEQTTKTAQEAAKTKNISTYREAEQHLATKQEEVAAANRADRETYQQAKKVAVDEQAKQQIIGARKDNLAKASEQIKPAIQNHLTNVRDAVFDALNQQWDKVRTAVGDNIKANPQSLTNAAKSAIDSVTEVNKDVFNKVLGNSFGGAEPSDLSWKDIQAAYTNLGNRLGQGGLPGDVWRGLKSFQANLGAEMESMANAAGVKNDLIAVKKNWGNAMTDWADTSKPMAKGGSPLAHAMSKVDPAGVAKVFEGPLTGPANRALKILARYKQYGADIGYPLRYRSILDEAETLPKPKGVKMPTEPTPRPTPEMLTTPYKPGPSDPNVAAYTPHPVEKSAIRAEQISKLKKKAAIATLPIGGALGYEIIHRLFGGGTSAPQPYYDRLDSR